MSDEQLSQLEGVFGPSLLLVLGPEASLPWAPGVRYLGRAPLAPSMLLPTTLQPSLPEHVLERALRRLVPGGPFAVLDEPRLVVPLALARRVDRGSLEGSLSR